MNPLPQPPSPDLPSLIAAFLLAGRAAGLAPKTLTWYEANLRTWAAFVQGRDWKDPLATREFFADLQSRSVQYAHHPRRRTLKRRLSQYTIRGYGRTVKRFFNWLVNEGCLDRNPVQRLALPKKKKRVPRGIRAEDFGTLLHACLTPRDRAILLFLRDTGCRVSEVCALKVGDVDLSQKVTRVTGKGDNERLVFLSAATCLALEHWLRTYPHLAADPLFVSRKGPLTPLTVDNLLRRLAARAAIAGPSNPHAFRHGFARDFLLDGGDLASLSDLLGHSDVQVTQMYSAFTAGELQELHRLHSPVTKVTVRGLKSTLRQERDKYLTIEQVAKKLKLSRSMVYKMVRQHALQPYREPIGPYGEILTCFKPEEIKALIEKRKAQRPKPGPRRGEKPPARAGAGRPAAA